MGVRVVAMIACGLVTAGCDGMFGLQDLHTDPDAAPDALLMHDEDLDGIDNSLDNCPATYNPDQKDDGDHDGVGDACDPHRTVAGDRLLLAEYFDGSTYAWTPDLGTSWALGGGAVQTTDSPDATNASLMLTRTIKAPTVAMGFTVLDYGADTTLDNIVEIAIAYPANSGVCHVKGMAAGAPFDEVVTDVEQITSQATNFGPPIQPDGTVTMSLTRESSSTKDGKCLVNATNALIVAGPATTFMDASLSVRVHFMKISLRYVLLYEVQ